jgi:hypothetical protein
VVLQVREKRVEMLARRIPPPFASHFASRIDGSFSLPEPAFGAAYEKDARWLQECVFILEALNGTFPHNGRHSFILQTVRASAAEFCQVRHMGFLDHIRVAQAPVHRPDGAGERSLLRRSGGDHPGPAGHGADASLETAVVPPFGRVPQALEDGIFTVL